MFDNISVSGSLPFSEEMISLGLDKNNLSFQTKDLDCALDSYVIQNGELFVQKYKNSKWIEGDKNGKTFMDKIGHLEREDPFLEKVYFHGEIYFCEFIHDVQDQWDCWIEFKAIFTEGKLQRIELFKFEKTSNAERKARCLEYTQELEKERGKWINKYFFYTKLYSFLHHKIWRSFWLTVANVANKIAF